MLHLHRSERADALVEPLAEMLLEVPADVLARDVVAVPTRGVERWLAQRLSHHLGAADGEAGVCANVSFESPGRLVRSVLAALADDPAEADPDADPWAVERLTWTVLAVVDACARQPWCAPLARHLGLDEPDGVRASRRLAVAHHLATLFTSYGVQRPGMVAGWAAGAGSPGPADLGWQAELWREVRDRLGPSPAERLSAVVSRLRDDAGTVPAHVLPRRLSVFGPTRLPERDLQVLLALSRHRDVHLWLPHPSDPLWQRQPAPGSPRRADLVPVARHPLLASMARDAVELRARLLDAEAAGDTGPLLDVHHPAATPPPTLLGELQRRLRADDPADDPITLAPDDRSVQVHACHGRVRQVEVLREALVGLFADDATLEPRDVLVMCPDVEVVAPLVAATFGLAGDAEPGEATHPGQLLRVQLADRSLRQTNPLLALLGRVLDLADGRVSASQVLDLAAQPPVRRRFRLADDDLDRVRDWAVEAGVHWGEGAQRRARFGLADLRQGTWDAALDRVLLGVAMADEGQRFVGPALPLDDVDSTDVHLAGRLAELVSRLAEVLGGLSGTHSPTGWLERLERALDLLAEPDPTQAWQDVQARAVLADVRRAAEEHEGLPLRLPDLRALLADRLRGRPTRAGFRTGALTVCSLEPMRSVPHRVVCLLGLDDGAFPRAATRDGDDLLLRDPCIGERDRRSEDRQLFLDAVTAAGEHLLVLYDGADVRTGAARPPAVPVSELLDALDATGRTAQGRPAREQVVVRQPLQPVDERNFTPAALGRPGPFSFDAPAERAALAARGPQLDRAPFLPRPLPVPLRAETVDLDDLVALFEHPSKWFLRRCLRVSLAGDEPDVDDRLPLGLEALQEWAVGDRLLTAALSGATRNQALNAEWRRGQVPPKELGRATLLRIGDAVDPVAAATRAAGPGEPRLVDVAADLPSGAVVTGTVPGVRGAGGAEGAGGSGRGGVVVRSVYSRLGPKHRLRAWLQLLALAASGEPDQASAWTAVTVGRGPGSRPTAARALLRAPGQARAAQLLDDLVRLRERARREPLPVPVGAGYAYAVSRRGGQAEVQALEEARLVWSGGRFPENDDEYHAICWGDSAGLDVLLVAPDPTEQGWWPEDATRLGVLARRLWQPLLDHEETEIS